MPKEKIQTLVDMAETITLYSHKMKEPDLLLVPAEPTKISKADFWEWFKENYGRLSIYLHVLDDGTINAEFDQYLHCHTSEKVEFFVNFYEENTGGLGYKKIVELQTDMNRQVNTIANSNKGSLMYQAAKDKHTYFKTQIIEQYNNYNNCLSSLLSSIKNEHEQRCYQDLIDEDENNDTLNRIINDVMGAEFLDLSLFWDFFSTRDQQKN